MSDLAKRSQYPNLALDFDASFEENLETNILPALGNSWTLENVKKAFSHLPVLQTIPFVCKKETCQCVKLGFITKEERESFEGKRCPVEVRYAMEVFAGYVNDLNVEPYQYVDLQHITELVRIDLLQRRVDMALSTEGIRTNEVGGIIQSIGEPVWQKREHELFQLQSRLRKDREAIYRQLMASRESKAKQAERAMKGASDAASLMSSISKIVGENK